MIQEILTYTAVIGAFGYTFYSTYILIRSAFITNEDNCVTSGCGSGCSGCGAKSELLNQLGQLKYDKQSPN